MVLYYFLDKFEIHLFVVQLTMLYYNNVGKTTYVKIKKS